MNNNFYTNLVPLRAVKMDNGIKAKQKTYLMREINSQPSAYLQDKPVIEGNFWSQLSHFFVQPAVFVSLLVLALTAYGAVGVVASEKTKPGDSLYIAKIVSEKTQLALTFNGNKRTQLNLEFAGNRAREIKMVLDQSQSAAEERDKKVSDLTQAAKKEINQVRGRIKPVTPIIANRNKIASSSDDFGAVADADIIENENETVFSANSGRSASGIQVYEFRQNLDIIAILDETDELFDKEDYDGVLENIKTAGKMIEAGDVETDNKDDVVKNESELFATTTPNVIEIDEAVENIIDEDVDVIDDSVNNNASSTPSNPL